MAAALRHTAKALQRKQAAAAAAIKVGRSGQQSQILVRGGPSPLVSSSRRFASFTGAQTNINAYAHGGIESEIQKKKDELYDLIAKGQQNVRTSTSRNAWLLLHLSEEVTPRPKEYLWCKLKSSSSGISGLKKIRVYALGLAAVECVVCYERYCEEKKVARAMPIEESMKQEK